MVYGREQQNRAAPGPVDKSGCVKVATSQIWYAILTRTGFSAKMLTYICVACAQPSNQDWDVGCRTVRLRVREMTRSARRGCQASSIRQTPLLERLSASWLSCSFISFWSFSPRG